MEHQMPKTLLWTVLNQSQGEMRSWWRASGPAGSFSKRGLDGFAGRTKPIFSPCECTSHLGFGLVFLLTLLACGEQTPTPREAVATVPATTEAAEAATSAPSPATPAPEPAETPLPVPTETPGPGAATTPLPANSPTPEATSEPTQAPAAPTPGTDAGTDTHRHADERRTHTNPGSPERSRAFSFLKDPGFNGLNRRFRT